MKYARAIVLAGLVTVMVNPASCQTTVAAKGTQPAVTSDQTVGGVKAATTDPEYVIGALDSLNINVWKEPELSGGVVVRNDGKISIPLLNDVPAAGDTPTQLAAVITDKLKQYVSDPHVTVVVTKIDSKKVFLLGEVGHVGPITMLPDMTVLQALASGGGFGKFANLKKIYILRTENGKQTKIPFNYKDVISGKAPAQNIALKAGDTIVVP
jgi:polysaccharide export outer membrane protein